MTRFLFFVAGGAIGRECCLKKNAESHPEGLGGNAGPCQRCVINHICTVPGAQVWRVKTACNDLAIKGDLVLLAIGKGLMNMDFGRYAGVTASSRINSEWDFPAAVSTLRFFERR